MNSLLVQEFNNIWSDFRRSPIVKDDLKENQCTSSDRDLDRIFKRLNNTGSRDVNLFMEYVGSYTVKKKSQKQRRNTKSKKIIQSIHNEGIGKEDINIDNDADRFQMGPNRAGDELPNSDENECIDNEEVDDASPTVLLLDFLKANNVLIEAFSVEKSHLLSSLNNNFESTPVFEEDLLNPIVDEGNVEDIELDLNNNEIETNNGIIDITTCSDSDEVFSSITHKEDSPISDEENETEVVLSDADEENETEEVQEGVEFKHPLEHNWSFWYFFPNDQSDWSSNLNFMTTVSTIEDFWAVFNWVDLPSEMKVGSDFSLFKGGIKPDWSDERNKNGGRFIIQCSKKETDCFWREILMALIGQQFIDEETESKVNGCVVSIRPKMNKISIWTSATDCVVEVDEALADLLGRRGVFLIHNS